MKALLASHNRAAKFHKRIQYGLEIKGRAADDLEYVGGGSLLLQRFARSSVRWRSSFSNRVFSMAMTA